MAYELSILYYTLQEMCERNELDYVCGRVYELLSENHLQAIKNSFMNNTKIAANGIVYLRIKGLANILRTGAANYFVYQGIDGIMGGAEIISIDGEEYISGPALAGLLDYRISTTIGKTKKYLIYSREIYEIIRELNNVNMVREIFLRDIEDKRKELKKARIKTYNISACEFSGTSFKKKSEVQFAHIESVITKPHLAVDINNGVIILNAIHAELTKMQIHDYRGMFEYCQKNGYSTDWAK